MNKITALLLAVLLILPVTGCGNLSPRLQNKIDNQNGKIGELESINQGLKAEVGKLQSQAEITNSNLDRLQQGYLNLQAGNDNSGVQILSGTGGVLIAAFIAVAAVVIVLAYRNQAIKAEKTAELLAQEIASREDPQLEDQVFKAAMHTDVERQVYNTMTKQQRFFKKLKSMKKAP